jgi:hypothetical protein
VWSKTVIACVMTELLIAAIFCLIAAVLEFSSVCSAVAWAICWSAVALARSAETWAVCSAA